MIRKTLVLSLVGLALLCGVVYDGWQKDRQDIQVARLAARDPAATGNPAMPPTPPPAPPSAEPSRKQEGGPALRADWDIMRLADPSTGRIPPDIHRREMEFARDLPSWQHSAWIDRALASENGDALRGAKVPGWRVRGPFNVGGRTRALAIDVGDPGFATILAGGVSGGMWRSIDDGASWVLTTGSSQLHSVTCVAQDTRPGHREVWYYGTGERIYGSAGAAGAPFRGDGIFRSTDAGVSWTLLPATSTGLPHLFDNPFNYVFRVATDASEAVADEVYAATAGIVYRSIDGGDTWDPTLGNPASAGYAADVIVASDGVVYGALSTGGAVFGVYRSLDGLTWTDISPPDLTSSGRMVMTLAPSDEDVLYLLAANRNGSSDGIYKYTYLSGDGSGGGGQWENRSANLAGLPGPGGGSWNYESYDGYAAMVAVAPDNPDLVFLGGVHLIRSRDGFASTNQNTWIGGWQYSNHHADLQFMLFRPGSATVAYTSSDGGLHRTLDANAPSVFWQSLNNGYNTSQFYAIDVDPNLVDSDAMVGGTQDNGSWWVNDSDSDALWTSTLGGDGAFCAVASSAEPSGTYYFSFQNGVVYRYNITSEGSVLNWARVDPAGGGAYMFINPFILDPNETTMMYLASSQGIWRNDDLTRVPDWNTDPTPIAWTHLTTTPSGPFITALAVSRSANRILYFGTTNGWIFRLDNANTAPGGSEPTMLNPGTDLPYNQYTSGMAIHPEDDQEVLLSHSNYGVVGLWHSIDGGASWDDVEGNLAGQDGPSVRDVVILRRHGLDYYFAATSTGLYSTTEIAGDATVWQLEADEIIGNVVVDKLATRPADGLLAAGTHGKGNYSVYVNDPVDVPDAARATVLAQNSPNPFNPRTSIAFDLPRAATVRLDVYDVAGRHVARLVDGTLDAGEHSALWDGTDGSGRRVGAGTYLYRLRSDGFDETRRMTLVK